VTENSKITAAVYGNRRGADCVSLPSAAWSRRNRRAVWAGARVVEKGTDLSVASGDRMCSNLQACCSISVSLSMASESVKRRSARRCRRMMSSGALLSRRVSSIDQRPSPIETPAGLSASVTGIHERFVIVRLGWMRARSPGPSLVVFPERSKRARRR